MQDGSVLMSSGIFVEKQGKSVPSSGLGENLDDQLWHVHMFLHRGTMVFYYIRRPSGDGFFIYDGVYKIYTYFFNYKK
jgi:hypothetical protein